jgi:hypothetical protein
MWKMLLPARPDISEEADMSIVSFAGAAISVSGIMPTFIIGKFRISTIKSPGKHLTNGGSSSWNE